MEDVREPTRETGVRPRSRPGALFPALLVALMLAACSGGGTGEGGLSVSYRLDPAPPAVGSAAIELRLVDPEGKPVTGAQVELEANMNHAGMTPTFATLTEAEGGRYDGQVEFTMGGDWFLLMNATLPDGRTVERTLDVKGVRSKQP